MKKRFIFKGISLTKFNIHFKNDEDCYEYISNIKWDNNTFVCKRCGNTHHCKGNLPFSRRCTRCKHDESPTAGTMFDKIKFPILTAFHIIFDLCRLEKDTSSAILSKKYGIRQKTIWAFKRKIQLSLNSQGINFLEGVVFLSSFCVDTQNEFERIDNVLIAGEILPNGQVGRAYGYYMEHISQQNIQMFFDLHISAKAKVYTIKDNDYELYPPNYNIEKNDNHSVLDVIHAHILNVRSWLYGIHRRLSTKYLQGYLNEYYYRFNWRDNKNIAFDNAIMLMVYNQPIRDSIKTQ